MQKHTGKYHNLNSFVLEHSWFWSIPNTRILDKRSHTHTYLYDFTRQGTVILTFTTVKYPKSHSKVTNTLQLDLRTGGSSDCTHSNGTVAHCVLFGAWIDWAMTKSASCTFHNSLNFQNRYVKPCSYLFWIAPHTVCRHKGMYVDTHVAYIKQGVRKQHCNADMLSHQLSPAVFPETHKTTSYGDFLWQKTHILLNKKLVL